MAFFKKLWLDDLIHSIFSYFSCNSTLQKWVDFHFEECDQQDPHKDDEAMTMSSTTDKKDGRAPERERIL